MNYFELPQEAKKTAIEEMNRLHPVSNRSGNLDDYLLLYHFHETGFVDKMKDLTPATEKNSQFRENGYSENF